MDNALYSSLRWNHRQAMALYDQDRPGAARIRAAVARGAWRRYERGLPKNSLLRLNLLLGALAH